jgi:hypothetical protein
MIPYSRILFYPSLYFTAVAKSYYSGKNEDKRGDVLLAGKLVLNAIHLTTHLPESNLEEALK